MDVRRKAPHGTTALPRYFPREPRLGRDHPQLHRLTMRRQAIYTEDDFHALRDKGRIWNFHDEDTNEHLHTLHPYPAKFIPQIPRTAIARWSKRGNLVYDPFCGCGTTLLEASLAGRPSIGTDNNAVAILVARAKTTLYSPADLDRLTTFAHT